MKHTKKLEACQLTFRAQHNIQMKQIHARFMLFTVVLYSNKLFFGNKQ